MAFLPFVLMLLSDLICIQITSPGGSPIRGKNAVRASRHTTPRHAVTTTPSRPVPSSPPPSPPLQPPHLQLWPLSTTATTHIHSQPSPPVTHPFQVWIVDITWLIPALGLQAHRPGLLGQPRRQKGLCWLLQGSQALVFKAGQRWRIFP